MVIDKVPMFTTAHLWSDTHYPQPGFIECRLLERMHSESQNLARISVEPYHVEWTNEALEFVVFESDLCEMTPFVYGGFYDVPRCLTLRYRGRHFLLLSGFDDDLDEYETDYFVYQFPEPTDDSRPVCSPDFLSSTPMNSIGRIPIDQIAFDPSKRQKLDARILDPFIGGI
ncbi:MAG: hypothetical protein JST28_22150 [Acidobacteria bacterium]|nr:hypothetical protein [Acidobacteriota bacterium]